MKKSIGLLVFVVLVLAPFALTSQNFQAHPASSDPAQVTMGDLTWMLAAFSGTALLALYALQLIVSAASGRRRTPEHDAL
jgi:hypothetical protein